MSVGSSVGDLLREVVQTVLRFVPWPTEAGLRKIGRPDSKSPVLITGNYDLTVRRLVRALRGIDAWLVVAPSRGINVWCAASGGHLTTHQVVTALRTSGVEDAVKHRRAILPQLAATGVRAVEVSRRSGWMIRFGPVYGGDIGDYLQRGEKKTDEMRHVHFSALERFEMSVAWAAPLTLLLVPLALLIRPGWCLPLVALTWFLALVVHYVADRIPAYPRLSIGATAIVLSTGTAGLTGGGWVTIGFAALAATILTSVLAFDVEGSSPTGAPSNFDGHEWRITLDLDRCVGAYRCWEVCPEACFDKRADAKKIELARPDQCIRCGACVVQCPVDALFFRDSDGESVSPETIRRFKLNLLGRRNIKSGSDFPVESPPARSGSR